MYAYSLYIMSGKEFLLPEERKISMLGRCTHTRGIGRMRFKQKPTSVAPGLITLTQCLRRYVESSPNRFRIIEHTGKSRVVRTVLLRDPVEP